MKQEQNFSKYLVISIFMHLIFILIFIYGIPTFFTKKPLEEDVIIFEMVKIEDITNVINQNPKTSKTKEVKNAKKTQKTVSKKEIKKEPEKPKSQPKQENKIPIPKKKLKEKKTPLAPKKPEPKKETKKVRKSDDDVIDSILKELEKTSEGQEKKSSNNIKKSAVKKGNFAKGKYGSDAPLSITEKMLIKKQIEANWQTPVGLMHKQIEVTLDLQLSETGIVYDIKIGEVICPMDTKANCDLLTQSAIRAIKKASPLRNLRLQRYEVWQNISLRFDPSGMM